MPSIPEEPLLAPNPNRFCMFPIQYPQIWEMYKKAEASFWTAEELDLSQNHRQWETRTDGERHFITHVLVFFAALDGIILENLAGRFMKEVLIAEVRAFYGFQIAIKNIHSEFVQMLLARQRLTSCVFIRNSGQKIGSCHDRRGHKKGSFFK
ncbi:putative ribonucleoside-diphosphate reductase [Helianthus anomalus]